MEVGEHFEARSMRQGLREQADETNSRFWASPQEQISENTEKHIDARNMSEQDLKQPHMNSDGRWSEGTCMVRRISVL